MKGWKGLGARALFFPAVLCLLGVVWGPEVEWPRLMWWGLTLGSGGLAWWLGQRPGALLTTFAASFSLGAALAEGSLQATVPPLHRAVQLEGRVESTLRDGVVLDQLVVEGVPFEGRVRLHVEAALEEGQRVAATARLSATAPAANPGEWSRVEWAWRRGQLVNGSVVERHVAVTAAAPAWRQRVTQAHRHLRARVQALTDDREAGGLVLTLAAGARDELDDETERVFAASGLAHVLSVSGLHVAVFAFAIFGALRFLLTRRMTKTVRLVDARAFAAPMAVPMVWFYVVFTGWQAPAVRSGVMCSVLLGGWVLRRRSDPLTALVVAGVAMLALDPASPFELSVQLSFVAVLALMVLAPRLRELLPLSPPSPKHEAGWRLRGARWREAAVQTLCSSAAVTLATAPLVLTVFQQVSVAGLLSNVVTLPITSALTLVSATGAALEALWAPLGGLVLWLAVMLAKVFVAIARLFAGAPFATLEAPEPTSLLSGVWWLGLVGWATGAGRWRLMLWLCVASVLGLGLLGRPSERTRVTFLSVGHGDAIVVSSMGQHALVDGGGVPKGRDVGQRVVLPYLRSLGVRRLALVALSHAHPDHALGLSSVLAEMETDALWLPFGTDQGPLVEDLLVAAGDAPVSWKRAGDRGLQLGELTVEPLGPPRDLALDSENDRSLVLLVRHREVSFLLTGDLEALGESALHPPAVTVLKAPHHGSDTSSTDAFVEATAPRHVVFCVGRNNRYGFPRESVVERYLAAGARCHRTDLGGAISFTSDGRDVEVEQYRPRIGRRLERLTESLRRPAPAEGSSRRFGARLSP